MASLPFFFVPLSYISGKSDASFFLLFSIQTFRFADALHMFSTADNNENNNSNNTKTRSKSVYLSVLFCLENGRRG